MTNKYNVEDTVFIIDNKGANGCSPPEIITTRIDEVILKEDGYYYKTQRGWDRSTGTKESDVITDGKLLIPEWEKLLAKWERYKTTLMREFSYKVSQRVAKTSVSTPHKAEKHIFKSRFKVGQKVYSFCEYNDIKNKDQHDEFILKKMEASTFIVDKIKIDRSQKVLISSKNGKTYYEEYFYETEAEVIELIKSFRKRYAEKQFGIIDLDKE
jgi:hypothetical protein